MALRTRGPELAAVYAELGPIYVDDGRLDQAVTVLETAVKEAGNDAALPVAQRNLAIAYFKRAAGADARSQAGRRARSTTCRRRPRRPRAC